MQWMMFRVLSAVPTLIGVVLVAFLMTRLLPGDPVAFFAAYPGMSAADIAEVRAELGLDGSLAEQFVRYVQALLRGDLGRSMMTGQPVLSELMQRLPATFELTICAFALALFCAVTMGICAARRPGSLVDRLCLTVAGMGIALPTFLTGLLLIYVAYFQLGLVPEPSGRLDPFLASPPRITGMLTVDAVLAADWVALRSALGHLVLPVLSMALFAFGPLMRMMRASMIRVNGTEYIRSARALGLPPARILCSYAFPNAVVPVIMLSGTTLAHMIAANVLIEQVFAWPGIGSFALSALLSFDYAAVQGFVLFIACLFICLNLVADLIAGALDPRIGLM